MQVFDLTHTLETGMPVFPGTEQAALIEAANIASEGYHETRLQLSVHTGTHIDCGRHFFESGSDTGKLTPEHFIGRGLVIDCRHAAKQQRILKSHLQLYANKLEIADFVLFHTGWSHFWGRDEYFKNFPVPDPEAARYLTGFRLKGVGTDTISFDPVESHDYPVHRILLSRGFLLIENLASLEDLPESGFIFSCLPLKIKDGDGSPVRAVGIVMSNACQLAGRSNE
jgi:kynurenine formamidase